MAFVDQANAVIGKAGATPGIETAGSLLLAGRGRTIMGIFADVTIEEKHKDEVNITEHPVEVGSAISDHAYMSPPEVAIKIGWSESSGSNLAATYIALQQLEKNYVLLVVNTGKRLYTNMLIKSLGCTTDEASENTLMIDLTIRKVELVQTSETTVLIENQQSPDQTSSVENGGTVQPQAVDKESILSKAVGAFFG